VKYHDGKGKIECYSKGEEKAEHCNRGCKEEEYYLFKFAYLISAI